MDTVTAYKLIVTRYFDIISGRRTDLRLED